MHTNMKNSTTGLFNMFNNFHSRLNPPMDGQSQVVVMVIGNAAKQVSTVNPYKFAGINVRILVPVAYSQELKFVVQLWGKCHL